MGTAEAYDSTLTRRYLGGLLYERMNLAGTSVGTFMLFGGGANNGSGRIDSMEAFGIMLVRTSAPAMTTNRQLFAAARTDHYALFAGGYNYPMTDTVDVYDENLLRLTPLTLPGPSQDLAGTTKDGYAIFGGGYDESNPTNAVAIFDDTLTRILPKGLSVARGALAATHAGDYVLFGGGVASNNISSSHSICQTVDVYTLK